MAEAILYDFKVHAIQARSYKYCSCLYNTVLQIAEHLNESSVSFSSVTVVSAYIASVSLTFEVKLNSSENYQSNLDDFLHYFNDELTILGEYAIQDGSKGSLVIVPAGAKSQEQ